jgi:hypothetical protein
MEIPPGVRVGIPDEVVRGEWRPDPYLWEA